MQTFNRLLINSLFAGVTNSFVWFALTFWAYLETRSVLATSIIGGSYMLLSAGLSLYFGTFVDHHRKKIAMLYSSLVSMASYLAAATLYLAIDKPQLLDMGGLWFWLFVVLILTGAVVGNMRMIALSTTVTMLVPKSERDKANGLVGTVNGIAFTLTSVFSGLAIGFAGMGWSLIVALALTAVTIVDLLSINIKEKKIVHLEDGPKPVDIKGALAATKAVPGLMALVFFATFNNFLGGVFMSLMDPYGLNLVSVQTWGLLWGVLSGGFILGGIIVSKKGLGPSPLKSLFQANIVMWVVCIFFTIKASIILLAIGLFIYMCLIPVVEAAEQTIIQRVVPFSSQGRVFGFAQSLESAAAPITAFLIGPIAEWFVIPFMTDGRGANSIGSWFGTGPDRGMALIFITAGVIGLVVTVVAFSSRAYKILSSYYAKA